MQQLSKTRTVLYHLYPGVIITICFALLTPLFINHQLPPQFSILIVVGIVAIPLLLLHLNKTKKEERRKDLIDINGYRNKLPTGKLILIRCRTCRLYVFHLGNYTAFK